MIWEHTKSGRWQLTRVVSYGHRALTDEEKAALAKKPAGHALLRGCIKAAPVRCSPYRVKRQMITPAMIAGTAKTPRRTGSSSRSE